MEAHFSFIEPFEIIGEDLDRLQCHLYFADEIVVILKDNALIDGKNVKRLHGAGRHKAYRDSDLQTNENLYLNCLDEHGRGFIGTVYKDI